MTRIDWDKAKPRPPKQHPMTAAQREYLGRLMGEPDWVPEDLTLGEASALIRKIQRRKRRP